METILNHLFVAMIISFLQCLILTYGMKEKAGLGAFILFTIASFLALLVIA